VIEPVDLTVNADPTVKLDQIRTAAKQHVLAVVDDFGGSGMLVRRGSSAKVGTTLKQRHSKSRSGERAGSGQASEAASG
jgi:hypothetical protein